MNAGWPLLRRPEQAPNQCDHGSRNLGDIRGRQARLRQLSDTVDIQLTRLKPAGWLSIWYAGHGPDGSQLGPPSAYSRRRDRNGRRVGHMTGSAASRVRSPRCLPGSPQRTLCGRAHPGLRETGWLTWRRDANRMTGFLDRAATRPTFPQLSGTRSADNHKSCGYRPN